MKITTPATRDVGLPERGEFVLRGGYVITMDPSLGDLAGADVHVRDGTIVAVGAVDVDAAIPLIDATGSAVMPGFVDTHWHLWNSLLRGLVGDGQRSYFPVKNKLAPHLTPQDTYASATLALTEAITAGITTLNDWDHNVRSPAHADANAQAILDSGLRARYSYGNADKLDPATLMDLADVDRFGERWLGAAGDERISLGMAVRGPVRTEPRICAEEWAFARSRQLPMTMHCGGRRGETDRYCELLEMAQAGQLGPDLQVVHAVHSTTEEIAAMADTGTHLSLSPLTELRSMGIPPTGAFLEAGLDVSLSMDTIALPTVADMFLQMNVTLSVEKARDPESQLTPRKVLEMATLGGARDLGMADRIGSLVPGKRADLITLRLDSLNMAPAADPLRTAFYCARPSDIDLVVADGRILKRDGRLAAHDGGWVVHEANAALAGLVARAGWDIELGVAADVASA
jgi:5-methylthioadenosine/S-adenosylhomocysteine deaminase